MIIAIDGPAASGKGTLGRRLGLHYGLPHLDTGLLYRAVARALLDASTTLDDAAAAAAAAARLDPAAFVEERLRGAEMGEAASVVAAIPEVRAALVELQRRFGEDAGAVLDGRDIGTAIRPDAHAKIFLTAAAGERALRRWREFEARGEPVAYEAILADIERRDARDSGRVAAPLKPAPDARLLDTTGLDVEAVVAAAIAIVDGAGRGLASP